MIILNGKNYFLVSFDYTIFWVLRQGNCGRCVIESIFHWTVGGIQYQVPRTSWILQTSVIVKWEAQCSNMTHGRGHNDRYEGRRQQCDQIWRNFTTLAKVNESLANFYGLFPIWQNAYPTLANLWHYWANFQFCKWPNIDKWSNHLVTLCVDNILALIQSVQLQMPPKKECESYIFVSYPLT